MALATDEGLAVQLAKLFGKDTKSEDSTRRLGVDHAYSKQGRKQLRVRVGRLTKGAKRVKILVRFMKGAKASGANIYML